MCFTNQIWKPLSGILVFSFCQRRKEEDGFKWGIFFSPLNFYHIIQAFLKQFLLVEGISNILLLLYDVCFKKKKGDKFEIPLTWVTKKDKKKKVVSKKKVTKVIFGLSQLKEWRSVLPRSRASLYQLEEIKKLSL